MNDRSRNRLFNPGPVTLSARVRAALAGPDLCHREPEYAALQQDVRCRLARVYAETADAYEAVLLTGSGTAAVEAMLDSLLGSQSHSLVVANGVYGERMASILEIHRKSHRVFRQPWTEHLDLEGIAASLDSGDGFTHVVAVHHETTTGRLNPIDALAVLCRQRGLKLLLDTVSSFGGEPLEPASWGVEAFASTANKCLHGVPGISFVMVQKTRLDQDDSAATTLYLDLFKNYQQQRNGFPLFTPPVQSLFALQAALVEFEAQGGWPARHATYLRRSQKVRRGYARLGLRPVIVDLPHNSSSLTAFALPPKVTYDELFRELKEVGLIIYPGQGHLMESFFRIAVMGDLTDQDIQELVSYTEAILSKREPHGDREPLSIPTAEKPGMLIREAVQERLVQPP